MFLISVGSLFHNLGADKVKARPAVLLSALKIVFGTNKEILSIYVRLRSITELSIAYPGLIPYFVD